MSARSRTLAEAERLRCALRSTICRGRELQLHKPVEVRPSRNASESANTAQWRALQETYQVEAEDLELLTDVDDANGQDWTPTLLMRPKKKEEHHASSSSRPCVVVLHATGGDRRQVARYAAQYASRGYLAISIDSRHHGVRSCDAYNDALIRAWQTRDAAPFLYDTVFDLMRVLDYILESGEIDPSRVGVTGISLGGMHAWLWSAVDKRVVCTAPMIGVQSFSWAIQQDSWQARAESLRRGSAPSVFDVATSDLGKEKCDAEVVKCVWDRIAPGLLTHGDAPQSLPLIAPRPLLVLNGEKDPRCPLPGLRNALDCTKKAYTALDAEMLFEEFIQPGIGHEATPEMHEMAAAFLDRHLNPSSN